MKKLLCVLLSMCLIFCSCSLCFAVTIDDYKDQFTSGAAVEYDQFHLKDSLGLDTKESNNTKASPTAVSDTTTHNLLNDLIRVFTGSGGTMYNSVSEFMSWLTPVGSFSTNHSITGVTQYEIVDYIAWTLSGTGATVYDTIANIASLSAYLPNLESLSKALTNYFPNKGSSNPFSVTEMAQNAHRSLLASNGSYSLLNEEDGGQVSTSTPFWQFGSPLGNLAYIMTRFTNNQAWGYKFRWAADLTHYNDNLTTWDSQGSTLTQVGFTPDSAIQGLYRYLAFTQRDVARLTYVFANDEELEARELAQANQDQVLDDFIDPTGDGAASTNDISAISDISSGYKDNFGSNASVTGIFDIFDSDHMGWFSQETKNQLDTTASRSKGGESDTPLLDKQIQEIYDGLGVKMP